MALPDGIHHGLDDSDSLSRYGGEISYILLRDNKEILGRKSNGVSFVVVNTFQGLVKLVGNNFRNSVEPCEAV